MLYPGRGDGRDGALVLGSDTVESDPLVQISIAAGVSSTTISTGLTINPGDLFFLHQTQGTNHGRFDWLFVSSYTSGTGAIVFTSPALFDFSSAGVNRAQARLTRQYTSMNTGAFTMSARDWDGIVGGMYTALCLSQVDGLFDAQANGFVYGIGRNGGNTYSFTGEGHPGPSVSTSTPGTINGNGGGLAFRNAGDRFGGGGGSNYGVGTAGQGSGSGQVGSPGLTSSAADGSLMDFGGGGGGGVDGSNAGDGGFGGGLLWIIGRNFGTGSMNVAGEAGKGDPSRGGGGGGAAGCARIQGEYVDFSLWTFNLTGGAGGSTGASVGGAGGLGLGHVDVCTAANPGLSNVTTLVQGGSTWCSILGSIL